MNYSQLLSKSYAITNKHRWLWLLSLLTILGGVANEESFGGSFNFDLPSNLGDSASGSLENIWENILTMLPIIIGVILVLGLISLVFFILGLIAKGGLIDGIIKIEQKKATDFSAAMTEGKKYAWRIFLVRLLFGIGIVLFVIISIPIMLVLFFLFFLTIPALWLATTVISLILHISQIMIVAQNITIFAAIKKSWILFRKNWKEIAIMWLINFGLGLAIGLVMLLATLFIGLIVGVIVFLAYQLLPDYFWIVLIGLVPIGLVLFAAALFLGSVLNTYFTSFWTLGINKLIVNS